MVTSGVNCGIFSIHPDWMQKTSQFSVSHYRKKSSTKHTATASVVLKGARCCLKLFLKGMNRVCSFLMGFDGNYLDFFGVCPTECSLQTVSWGQEEAACRRTGRCSSGASSWHWCARWRRPRESWHRGGAGDCPTITEGLPPLSNCDCPLDKDKKGPFKQKSNRGKMMDGSSCMWNLYSKTELCRNSFGSNIYKHD